jgi:hypothetical protein
MKPVAAGALALWSCVAMLAPEFASADPHGIAGPPEPLTPEMIEARRVQMVDNVTVWLPRLVGRYRYEGTVQFFQTLAPLASPVAPAPADDWAGLQGAVISRMRAEEQESWSARAQRFIDDVHLVWIGLASATATIVVAGSILTIMQTLPFRNDSLAAVFAMLSAPSGSNLNPASLDGRGLNKGPTPVLVPTVPQDGIVYATLENSTIPDGMMVPLKVRLTTEGLVQGLEVLDTRISPRQAQDLKDALSRGRFQPALHGNEAIAVNLVWLLATTTVKPGKT